MKKDEIKIGDVIEGTVTGIQNYGVFVQLNEDTQGLVHISECKHGYVSDLSTIIKINQTLKVKVIDVDEYTQKISLSMRALKTLNTPPFPAKMKKRRRRHLPKIGFKTIDKSMPKWIDEGLEAIEHDEFNLKNK